MKHYLGIDIGTYASKGVLVDGEGRIVASADKPHKMLVPQPGWAEHRPREDWWDDFTFISRKLIAESGVAPADIAAVACSAIGPCMLPVDAGGEPLMNGVLYGVDARAAKEIVELTERIGEDVLLDRCGNALTSQSVGPKILWLKRNRPEIFAGADKIVTATTFLVERLTGETVIDHYTAANFSPLYVVDKLDWSTELADDIVGIDRLPKLLWSTEIAGTVTARAAEETGLAVGTPVTAGTIDAAAEALSVGVLEDPGDMMMMYGSTIFIITLTDERVRDPRLWYAPWLFEGQHASMSGLATSGTLTHWFRERFAQELDPDTAFVTLAGEAEQSPRGANGLVLLPYFSGERTPIHDPFAKGVLFGLNLTHSRGDVYRALLEGIAYGTNHVIETYADVGQAKRILGVGGGTKNRVWSQATSDISGLNQILRSQTVGASYGDAFLAALAVGDVSRQDIATWNPVESEIVAEPAEVYRRQYGVFRGIYERTADLMHALDG